MKVTNAFFIDVQIDCGKLPLGPLFVGKVPIRPSCIIRNTVFEFIFVLNILLVTSTIFL